VLVVEDDRSARRAIVRILQRQGFILSEADSVKQAMFKLADPPNWILLDLMLPDGSGTEVLRKVGEEGLPSQVCVITGCAAPDVRQLMEMGARDVLMKPVNVDRLLALLCEPPVEALSE
jgi:DNA-binding response OmpR family regulator